MTSVKRSPTALLRGATAAASQGYGIKAAACLTAGAYLIAGLGVALVVLGLIFLLAAWGER